MARKTKTTLGDDAGKGDQKRTPAHRLKSEAERCRKERREFITTWENNIDRRRAAEYATDDETRRRHLPTDWSMVNAKMSQLFSQVPQVVVKGRGPYKPAAQAFAEQLNYRLENASVGSTMNEIMADVINAAGIGIVKVEYSSTEGTDEGPEVDIDPTIMALRGADAPVEMTDRLHPVDRRFDVIRISPDHFIWPLDFKGSNFNKAPFLGEDGEMTADEAAVKIKLTPAQIKKAIGKSRGGDDERMVPETENQTDQREDTDFISYTQLFYWRYLYHREEKYFDAIQHVVFVDGIDEPVINEPWKGQRFDPMIKGYIGSCKFPIQVLTLHYISDQAIPPSDTEMAGPLSDGLERSFVQFDEQREYSKPVRWVNTNRIDADIMYMLMLGRWQGHIPTNGRGDDAIGEVSRSSYPNEDFAIHREYESAIQRAFSIGPSQMGVLQGGRRSATEANYTQANFTTRITQERAMGVQFFLNIADVMAGFICMFDDFDLPSNNTQGLLFWDSKRISHKLAFSVRADSSVILDSGQRLERVERFINNAGKSGLMIPKPVLEEYAALSGFDPHEVIGDPPVPKDEPPNISFRFSGEDLLNPMAYGILLKSPYGLTKEELQAAITAVNAVKVSMQITTPPLHPDEPPTPAPVLPNQGPQVMTDDRPEWQSIDRVNSRRDASQNGMV